MSAPSVQNLPASGSISWYAHYSSLDAGVRYALSTTPVAFATLADAQAAGQAGQLAIGQLVVVG